jgi:lysophospholipase L1-like esterase
MAPGKRLLAGVMAGATLLAAALLATGVTANAQSNGGVRVMPLGDSITDGFNVPGGYRIDLWQSLVNGGHTVDFVGSQSNGPGSLGDRDHEGHSGWRIDQIDANIVSWLQQFTPRTVLLHIGTNDMFQNPGGASQRLSALIDRITATAPDTEVFVATIVPLPAADATVRAFNAAIPGIVQSKVDAGQRVHLVDMFSALTAADLADGVHPNAGGYAKMAAVWFDALQSVPGSLDPNPPTPSATTPPTSLPPQTGDCTATYELVNQWPGGFQAGVTVSAGAAALAGWTVQWTFPSGQTIVQLWNGVASPDGANVSVSNAAYNGSLAAGGATSFGFIGSSGGTNQAPTGLTCSSP